MKAAFAHLSPTLPAALAAAIGISLTVFLLPGAGLQSGPTPLLSSLGGAAGRVAADLPPAAKRRAPARVGSVRSSAQLVATRTALAPQRQRAATNAHRVHRRSPTRSVRRTPAAAVQVNRAAARAVPATIHRLFSSAGKAKGSVRRHGNGHAHRHGQSRGHSSEHHHRVGRGHSKKASTGSSHHPAAPRGRGGGNGHKGGKK